MGLAGNSESAFQQIHDTFRPAIHRYLARMVGENEAEDLTQEVFMRVSRALESFRGESQLSTWIYRIAANAAIDRMRAPSFRRAACTSSLDDSNETEIDVLPCEETPSPEQRLVREQRYKCFQDHLENLPANYRSVVELSEVRELANKEIAEQLGLSLDAVKIRLHRGRARLLGELRAHCKAEDWL